MLLLPGPVDIQSIPLPRGQSTRFFFFLSVSFLLAAAAAADAQPVLHRRTDPIECLGRTRLVLVHGSWISLHLPRTTGVIVRPCDPEGFARATIATPRFLAEQRRTRSNPAIGIAKNCGDSRVRRTEPRPVSPFRFGLPSSPRGGHEQLLRIPSESSRFATERFLAVSFRQRRFLRQREVEYSLRVRCYRCTCRVYSIVYVCSAADVAATFYFLYVST